MISSIILLGNCKYNKRGNETSGQSWRPLSQILRVFKMISWDTTWAYLICFHRDCVIVWKNLLNSPIITVPPAVWHSPTLAVEADQCCSLGVISDFFLGYGTITKLTCSLEQRGSWWTCCESPRKNQTLRPWRILQSRCLVFQKRRNFYSDRSECFTVLPWWSWHTKFAWKKWFSLVKVVIAHQVKTITFIHCRWQKLLRFLFKCLCGFQESSCLIGSNQRLTQQRDVCQGFPDKGFSLVA